MALRLRGATSGYIELKAPASAGDNTLTLPVNNGSANQILKTDGSGNLSWTNDSATDSTKLPLAGGTLVGNVIHNDNVKAIFGTSSDGLEIFHDGNHSYVKDTGTGYLRIQAADYLQIGTPSTNAAFLNCEASSGAVSINHNGNTRIETTNLGAKISSNQSAGYLEVSTSANLGDGHIEIKAGEAGGAVLSLTSDEGDDNSDFWRIQNAGDGILGFRSKQSGSWVEKLAITEAGAVQINADTGSAYFSVGASQDFKWYHDANGPTIMSDSSNQGFKLAIKELNLTEYSGVTTRLKIDVSGRVLIGRTTAMNGGILCLGSGEGNNHPAGEGLKLAPTANTITFFDSSSNGSDTGNIKFHNTVYNNTSSQLIFHHPSGNTGGFYFSTHDGTNLYTRFAVNNTGVWNSSLYNSNSNAGLSANIFVYSDGNMGRATSSGQYKKNIETIQDSYADKILTMRPTWYQQDETKVNIPQDQNKDWGYWGFIAEEVAVIDPRLVTWKVAEYTQDPNDGSKKIRTPLSEPEPDNVAYERFVPHLVNLLKRQAAKIETLETKVAALESA